MQNNKINLRYLIMTGLFIALGIIIPQLFHFIGAGPIFLPMYIPVVVCAFICPPIYGIVCAILTPILSCFITGMPPLMPMLPIMIFALFTLAFVVSIVYKKTNKIYVSLIIGILAERIVSVLITYAVFKIIGNNFLVNVVLINTFVKAWPGMLLQLVFVPPIINLIKNNKKIATV